MSFILNFSVGIILTFLSMSSARMMLAWMNTPETLIADAWAYIEVIFGGILISLSYNFLSGILRALGNSRDPLIAMIIAFLSIQYSTSYLSWSLTGVFWGPQLRH